MNNIINEKKEGKWLYYYSNGNIRIECFYKDDRFDGELISYFMDGLNIDYKCFYKNGIKNGKYISYRKNGVINQIREYNNDFLVYASSFYLSGKIKKESFYENNNIIGLSSFYDKEDNFISKRFYSKF